MIRPFIHAARGFLAVRTTQSVRAACAFLAAQLPLIVRSSERLSEPGELNSQYWLALNEGRDLDPFVALGQASLTEENRAGRNAEFNRRRREVLESIRVSPPKPEKRGSGDRREAVPGADWPSLGGNIGHTGATTERGPTRGEVLWKHPVGFDYNAGPLLVGETVYAASPGSETLLYAFDRRTGRILWVARRAPIANGLPMNAGGEIQRVSAEELCVPQLEMTGRTAAWSLIDASTGKINRTIFTQPTEREFQLPDSAPEPRRAGVALNGRAVFVKSLRSGRLWWRFPTGEVHGEPVLSGGRIFVGDDEGVLWSLNVDGPERVAWTARIGTAWAAPLAVSRDLVVGAANDGAVYAFSTATGTQLWRTRLGSPNPRARQHFSTPLLHEERVFVGAADGTLYCLDASTGALRWKQDAGDWIRARPYAVGKTVIVATLAGDVLAVVDEGDRARRLWERRCSTHPLLGNLAGDENCVFATDNAVWLHALDVVTGAPRWRHRLLPSRDVDGGNLLADAPPQIHQSPPTVREGVVFAGGSDRFLHAVDARTGRLLWRYEANGRIAAAPTIADALVLVGEFLGGRRFTALDARSGEPVWTQSLGGVWASPEHADGSIYVGTTDGKMSCLDAKTGRSRWSFQTGSDIYTAPALDAENVYFGSWDGHYYALNRRSGRLLWAWSPPGYPYHIGGRPDSAAAVLHEGALIVPIVGARYVALDTHTGRERWSWWAPGGICNATVAIAKDAVLVSTFGDTYVQPFGARLYALDSRKGVLRWQLDALAGLTAPVSTGAGLFICGSLTGSAIEAYRLPEPGGAPELIWRVRTGANMAESLPAVSGGLAFFLSNDGWLRAIW